MHYLLKVLSQIEDELLTKCLNYLISFTQMIAWILSLRVCSLKQSIIEKAGGVRYT